jgi:hypothetical protein
MGIQLVNSLIKAAEEFELRENAVLYGAILKLMEENYNWWVNTPREFVIEEVMKETKGRFTIDRVREVLDKR